jgi:hypothetical protein
MVRQVPTWRDDLEVKVRGRERLSPTVHVDVNMRIAMHNNVVVSCLIQIEPNGAGMIIHGIA